MSSTVWPTSSLARLRRELPPEDYGTVSPPALLEAFAFRPHQSGTYLWNPLCPMDLVVMVACTPRPARKKHTHYLELCNGDVPEHSRGRDAFTQRSGPMAASLLHRRRRTSRSWPCLKRVRITNPGSPAATLPPSHPGLAFTGTVAIDGKPAANLGLCSYYPDGPGPLWASRASKSLRIILTAEGHFALKPRSCRAAWPRSLWYTRRWWPRRFAFL